MNRFRRTPAHRAAPPGTSQPPATQRKLQPPHSASQPGRDNFARRFIQDVAAAATVAIGQNWPAPATANYRQHMMTAAYPLPHTIQVCIPGVSISVNWTPLSFSQDLN